MTLAIIINSQATYLLHSSLFCGGRMGMEKTENHFHPFRNVWTLSAGLNVSLPCYLDMFWAELWIGEFQVAIATTVHVRWVIFDKQEKEEEREILRREVEILAAAWHRATLIHCTGQIWAIIHTLIIQTQLHTYIPTSSFLGVPCSQTAPGTLAI